MKRPLNEPWSNEPWSCPSQAHSFRRPRAIDEHARLRKRNSPLGEAFPLSGSHRSGSRERS
jgi:hypothetical protein